MDRFDSTSDPSFVPLTPVRPSSPVGPIPPAIRAGEPIAAAHGTTTSSRSLRGRWLAGVLAVSMVSAVVASVGTVGVLGGLDATERGAGTPSAAVSSTAVPGQITISASDAVVAVAESASPAVVTLTVGSAGEGGFGPLSMPSTGVGSGFVFDASGLILTNQHVIDGGGDITVTFGDGTELVGTVIATDDEHDLAVVQVDAAVDLPTIPIGDASSLKVGQLVVAIGSPLGTFTESVTSGILSATGRTIEVGSGLGRRTTSMSGLLQTDAAINSGNSGGPLLDGAGNVIGVNVAVAQSAQGIGFAVPIDAANDIMAEARADVGAA